MADQVDGAARPVGTATHVSSSGGLVPDEWPSQVADSIVDTIDQVRERTAVPAVIAARGVVFGLLAGFLAVIAVVLLVILLIRLANNYLPGPIWIVYLGLGVIFSIGGTWLWVRAFSRPADLQS